MTPEQKTFLTSSSIKFHFNNYPLICMFWSKKSLHRLQKIHERSLRLTHQDYVTSYITILISASEKSIHQKYLAFFMIEVYKYRNGLSPQMLNDSFDLRKYIYNLKNINLFESQNYRKKGYSLDCFTYRDSHIWQIFPIEVRESISLKIFKHNRKTWYCNSYCNSANHTFIT